MSGENEVVVLAEVRRREYWLVQWIILPCGLGLAVPLKQRLGDEAGRGQGSLGAGS